MCVCVCVYIYTHTHKVTWLIQPNSLSCQWSLQYSNCIPSRWLMGKIHHPPKEDVPGMTLNCSWWWGCSSGDQGRWSIPSLLLLSGSFWLGVDVSVRVPPVGQIKLQSFIKDYYYQFRWNHTTMFKSFILDRNTWYPIIMHKKPKK